MTGEAAVEKEEVAAAVVEKEEVVAVVEETADNDNYWIDDIQQSETRNK
jgi:hypothetical protein